MSDEIIWSPAQCEVDPIGACELLAKLARDVKDERFVVMKLKERLDAVRDELGAAKALWLGIHTTPYHIESDDTTVRIPTLIYERLNDLLGKGVELEAR